MHHSQYTHTQVHKHAPLHPHKTVAIAQINIIDLPCMCLAVTCTLWYERDPIDPHPTRPPFSKGHHSITIDLLCVCVWGGSKMMERFEGMRHSLQKTNKNWTSLKVISINEYLNNRRAAQGYWLFFFFFKSNGKLMQFNHFFSGL